MGRNKFYIISTAVLLSLGIVYVATLAEHGGKSDSRVESGFCLKNIGLSDTEISDIKAIKLRYREEGVRIQAQKDIAMLHLKAALVDEVSKMKLEPLMAEVVKAKKAWASNKVACIRATSRVIKNDIVRKAYLVKAVECCLSSKKRCDKGTKSCDYKERNKGV